MARAYRILEAGEKFAMDLDRPAVQGGHAVIHRFVHASSTSAVENPLLPTVPSQP